ncbi:hypothetical protein ACO0LM_27695 [Undibacterium sp. Di26W]|uniref:hypothetical protein n=1 Tax=Undibacterium sp. Di26W TaxID=3413035 RepID=UPI003BF3E7A6
MKKLVRLLLLCILMLTIPVQGVLAASRLCCADEPSSALFSVSASASQQHLHQHHASTTVKKHALDHAASVDACCAATAILSQDNVLPLLRPSSERIGLIFSSYTGHISDGLERPPRS